MNRTPFVLSFLCLALPLFGQAPAPAPSGGARKPPTPEQIKARDERVLVKTGGLLDLPAEGPAVVVIDARAGGGAAPGRFAGVFGDLSRANVEEKRAEAGGRTPLAIGRAEVASGKAAIAIVVAAGGADEPALAVYPEERVAVVNAGRLSEGATVPAAEVRVLKEIWRGLGFAGGVGYADFPNDVMQPVFSAADLDANDFQVMQPMTFPKLFRTLGRLGVRRARRVPYRIAVRQGWAAAPTNRYQRAVWEQEKAAATNAPRGR